MYEKDKLKLSKEFWTELENKNFNELSYDLIIKKSGINKNKCIFFANSIYEILSFSIEKIEQEILIGNIKDFDDEEHLEFHDKLLECIISRFEKYNCIKNQISNLYNASKRNPKLATILYYKLIVYINKNLNVCGDFSFGFKRMLRIKGILFLLFKSKNVWLNDESKDLNQTISKIDTELVRLKEIYYSISKLER